MQLICHLKKAAAVTNRYDVYDRLMAVTLRLFPLQSVISKFFFSKKYVSLLLISINQKKRMKRRQD